MEPAHASSTVNVAEITLRGIRRRYGATVANDGIDITFQPASIHALVGENGAGKSTLMRILYGLLRPDAGEVRIAGQLVTLDSPARARAHGIGMIHQSFMLVPTFTVLENVILGLPGLRSMRRLPRATLAQRFTELSRTYGFDLDPSARVDALGVGERQRVEIARLLFHDARVLICDEPTAVLAPPEVAALFTILRRFRAEGRTVVFITHKLAEVLELADRVTVLRRGRVVGEAERGAFDRERLVRWIMGEEGAAPMQEVAPALRVTAGARESGVALEARSITIRRPDAHAALNNVGFELRRGEILGIAGVQGNGQRELAETISGRRPFDAGTLRIGAREFGAGEIVPSQLRPALIPEDRTTEGLIAPMTLWENLLLGAMDAVPFARQGWFAHAQARRWARPLLERYRLQPPNPDLPAEALSGGNAQKLLCAREISRRPAILVAAQPTRGIDIASTRFLHGLLRALRDAGGSILLISADLDEILEVCDRIAVLYRGALGQPRARAETDLERLGREMVGIA